MGEHISGGVFCKFKVAFMQTDGLPSRVAFDYKMDKQRMGNAERAVIRLFIEGLHNLCDTCRHAMRELRIATETAEGCPRNCNGLCKDNSHMCSMACKRIADALNEYRKGVNANAEKGQ